MRKVTAIMNEKLSKEFTKEELFQALKALPNGQAPREDGLPMEFF